MINTKTMTANEVFGEIVASRGVTNNSTSLTVIKALVDTTRQATEEVAEIAGSIVCDCLDGNIKDYMEVLTENKGEYFSNRTGEIVSVTLLL